MWRGATDLKTSVQLVQATGLIHGRFGCSADDAETLLSETADLARMDVTALAERLLRPVTREPALAAVAIVLRDRGSND